MGRTKKGVLMVFASAVVWYSVIEDMCVRMLVNCVLAYRLASWAKKRVW